MTKELLVVGAGNIGRGVIGGLFYESGYRLYLYDIMADRMAALKEQGHYLIARVGAQEARRVRVEGFEVLWEDAALVEAMTSTDLIACCVYEGAFRSICGHLAQAIRARSAAGKGDMNVLLCVNALGAPAYFNAALRKLLSDVPEGLDYFERHVGICQVMVGMAAMPSTPELLAEDPFAVTTRLDGHVDIDADHFKGEHPAVGCVGMVTKGDARIYRKVCAGNMKHCMTALLGHAEGYEFVADCYDNARLMRCVDSAFLEAAAAIQAEYHFDEEDHRQFLEASAAGLRNRNLKDPIARVCAKPISKLRRENRFVSPALLCLKHHILPFYLAMGIAYGLCYRDENDSESVEITDFVKAEGVERAIEKYCGLGEEDWLLRQLILAQYREAMGRR